MNREIKFRAWDKRNKTMFYDVQTGIDFDDGSHYKFSEFLEDKEVLYDINGRIVENKTFRQFKKNNGGVQIVL